MPDPIPDRNVFEHQRFLLRRSSDGTRLRKSFREIMTEPDAAYAFDYPQEFFNVAALGLMVYLAQAAFEPESVAELAERVREPLTEAKFEEKVARLRPHFRLTGDGPRFMQGPPLPEKKADPLSVVMMIAPKGDRQFLCRADAEWGVTPEQAGLLLFMRNTFYEGTGGRGYQKGTNGDTPIRTLVTAPAEGSAIWLRKSIWLNVLTRQYQRDRYEGDYGMPGEPGVYNGRFWEVPPPDDVPLGKITVQAALGWMTAFQRLHFHETEGVRTCPVTGETVTGFVASTVTKQSTGIAYGSKGDLDAGVRAERLFRHPNVPTRRTKYDKKIEMWQNEQPFLVDRTKGFVDALGAAFFGAGRSGTNDPLVIAPAVAQANSRTLRHLAPKVRLWTFGFHMLSNQRNVHGGFEMDSFRLPSVEAETEGEAKRQGKTAQGWTKAAADTADDVARALQRAVQTTAGVGVHAETDDTGNVRVKKTEKRTSSDYDYGRDVLAAYWRDVQSNLADHATLIAQEAPDGSAEATERVRAAWHERLRRLAWRHFRPVFDRFHTLPRTMSLAFSAQDHLAWNLNKYAPLPKTEISESITELSNQLDLSL